MKKIICSLGLSFLFIAVFAQIPEGYYRDAVGKKGPALKTALHNIIKDADVLSYGSGAGATWSGFAKTDRRPDGSVWDMYSNEVRYFNGNSSVSGMNIEHSFAKSWWGGGKNQAYKDLYHLNPSDSRANSARGSWPLGIVTGKVTYDNGVIKVGKCNLRPGGEIQVWEPADEYKGDFARAYMYMVTCYQNLTWQGNSEPQLDDNLYPVFEDWAIEMLLEWTRRDPVSEKERNRAREIYKIQGNRNPYIDFPDMAEYVWGRLKDRPFTEDGNADFPYISEPYSDTTVDFGTQVYLQSDSRLVKVKAANLTGDLSVNISGVNASMFSAVKTISKAEAEAGYDLQIMFTASETGDKTATLTLSGGGASAVTLALTAHATDDFMALPATNVTRSGFTANWTQSAGATGYTLDVYSLQSSGETEGEVLMESDFKEGLPAGWTKGDYAVKEAEGYRLASSKQAGSVSTSVGLDGSSATVSVNAKQYKNDNSTLSLTVNGKEVAEWTMTAQYADYTAELPAAETATIKLSADKGLRVFLSSFRLETTGDKPEPVSVAGYPKEVGSVLSYDISGLENDSVYYYTVLPAGNGASVSNAVQVRTGETGTGITRPADEPIHWFTADGVVYVHGLTAGTSLQIFDGTGTAVYSAPGVSEEMSVALPAKGMYLLRIGRQGAYNTYKIMNK